MRQVVLGTSGLTVSAVGFGGIPIMRVGLEPAVAAVRAALDLGVTFLDTAATYGDSEEKIGRAIRGRRDGLVIASKSGVQTRDEMLAMIERSRQRLGVDCIDLYQCHHLSTPAAWEAIQAPGGALEALLEARDRGHVAHVGVTSHSLDLALELIEHPAFETIQFPFNLVTSEPQERLIPRARELGLGFIVMKPMCGGQFDDAELAFRFLNAFPDLVPIPGIERPEEIRQIVPIVESGETLTGERLARAEQVVARLGKQFCRRCGYCQPCPEGVPIILCMVFESFEKRFSPARLKPIAERVACDAARCTECGECETQCPYELPIRQNVQAALGRAREHVR